MQIKTANGKTFLKISFTEWQKIGEDHGWLPKEAKAKAGDIKRFLEWQSTQAAPTQPVPLLPPQGNGGRGPQKPLPPAAAKGVVGPKPAGTKPMVPQNQQMLQARNPGLQPGPADLGALSKLNAPDDLPPEERTPATQALERAKKDLSQVNIQRLQTPAELAKAKQTAALLGNAAKAYDQTASRKAPDALPQ